jgi:hypothetical protein
VHTLLSRHGVRGLPVQLLGQQKENYFKIESMFYTLIIKKQLHIAGILELFDL